MEPNPLDAPNAEREQRPLILEPAELALDGPTAPVERLPPLRLARDKGMQPVGLDPGRAGATLAGRAAPLGRAARGVRSGPEGQSSAAPAVTAGPDGGSGRLGHQCSSRRCTRPNAVRGDPVTAHGWGLEAFACEELLACRKGDRFESINDDRIHCILPSHRRDRRSDLDHRRGADGSHISRRLEAFSFAGGGPAASRILDGGAGLHAMLQSLPREAAVHAHAASPIYAPQAWLNPRLSFLIWLTCSGRISSIASWTWSSGGGCSLSRHSSK